MLFSLIFPRKKGIILESSQNCTNGLLSKLFDLIIYLFNKDCRQPRATSGFLQFIQVNCHHFSSVVCRRPSSVVCRPSVNISHFNLLLRNHWANCNQTLVEWSLDGPLPKLCPVIPTSNQDGHQAKSRKKGG